MNNRNIEKSIARAVNQAPTLDFENLANIPVKKMTEHDFITKQTETQTTNHRTQFIGAFTCCFAILLCFWGWFTQYREPDSIITIDVNPSIEIITNRQNDILSVKALNEDTQKIIDGLRNKKSSDLNNTVYALISLIINYGYLNTDKNIVMISVENDNIEKADTLAISLKQVVKDSALSQKITPLILRQVFAKDKNASSIAAQYNLSVGKLKLIQELISSNTTFSIDMLATKSMEELLALSIENGIDIYKTIQLDDDYSDGKINNSSSGSDTGDSKPSQSGTGQKDYNTSQSGTGQKDYNTSQSGTGQKDYNSSQSGRGQKDDRSSQSEDD